MEFDQPKMGHTMIYRGGFAFVIDSFCFFFFCTKVESVQIICCIVWMHIAQIYRSTHPGSHNNLWFRNTRLYALMRKHLTTIDVDFVFDDNIFA